ncbi:unnamed protein product [Ambrosiozyma monospora]|uniref:Unnamed protein product n=1 Tax=Ambrosiozyma monospora TaxID=43982 RepID=A0ACB5TZL8_AMBMO|nr:unnamed protein product [Ambrosiozyma monospora]
MNCKLYESYKTALANGIHQPVSLALIRSDYMLDTATDQIKQIEFNTVSVSFGGLSTKVGELHSFLNENGLYSSNGSRYYETAYELPISDSAKLLAKGLYHGVSYYESSQKIKRKTAKGESIPNTATIVLMVIQPGERNAFDQRAVEYALFQNYGVRTKRVELPSVTSQVKVDPETHKLYYDGDEVSVVYYRSAYAPSEFTSPETWDARVVLESTLAIKCPSLLTQLSGAKKIQQLLTDDTILEKFLPVKDELRTNLQSTWKQHLQRGYS